MLYLFYGIKSDIGNNIDILSNSFDIFSKNVVSIMPGGDFSTKTLKIMSLSSIFCKSAD